MPLDPGPVPPPHGYQPAPPISPEEFALLSELLYRHVGIRLKSVKQSLVQSRLRKRLATLGLDNWGRYYAYLVGHDTEIPHFLDALTTNETFFLREEEHWEFLRRHIVPEVAARRRGPEREFSVWSAAASSGEELYSAALVLRESLPLPEAWRLRLVGSDVNGEVLERARKGCYGEYALRTLPAKLRQRYFTPEPPGPMGPSWQVVPSLRQGCRFARHNLLQPFPGGEFDLVLCRNVFIYFDQRAKERALGHLVPATAVGGYLVFSLTEALIPPSPHLERVRPSIYRRIS
ncbi:MAG TPA: protein-glutamate O-methyltransferase CheR [Deferrisomatales bacterium]|nr:protein-glutamate O-methyltransferase CheR [Deferrisomatales bacterium]